VNFDPEIYPLATMPHSNERRMSSGRLKKFGAVTTPGIYEGTAGVFSGSFRVNTL
jgi:hypothetical protein